MRHGFIFANLQRIMPCAACQGETNQLLKLCHPHNLCYYIMLTQPACRPTIEALQTLSHALAQQIAFEVAPLV